MRKTTIFIFTSYILPLTVLAAEPPKDFKALVGIPVGLINRAILLLTGIALLAFLWGVAEFILNAGNATELEEGKRKMFYGVIGLFILVSLWGIVALLSGSLGI